MTKPQKTVELSLVELEKLSHMVTNPEKSPTKVSLSSCVTICFEFLIFGTKMHYYQRILQPVELVSSQRS